MLPIKRSDVVKAKWQVLLISQAFMILFSIPFALIHGQVFKTNNVAGIDANVAYYGFGLMILGIFNVFFLTEFFKTAYKAGIAFLMGIIPASLIAIAVEVLVHFPNFAWLDSISGSDQLKQLPILVIGIIFYALMMWVAYKVSIKRFAKVNL
ncbi:hypothetical protein IV88_GL001298 [Pediococcus argentinicus]|uniref:Uncharacterized protein n=2 Tax=Pediococcus argentinicus TaxID=480391 RepID=A0A0R2NDZ0_9LACO|nr:hypothetical protein IV88_GL001298 [Pediococcus argentinicus]